MRRAAVTSGALFAGSLLAPRLVFAGEAGEAVFEMRVPRSRAASAAGGRWRSGPIEASRVFELIGVRLAGPDAGVEIRARGLDGRWSDWLAAHQADGHGPDGREARRADASAVRRSATGGSAAGRSASGGSSGAGSSAHRSGPALTDPVWTGPARAFELRAKRPLHGARVVLVDGGRRATAAATRYVDVGLPAGSGQPRIIARSSWATASCRPRVPAVFGAVELAFVHHTVSSNSYRPSQSAGMVRSICLFHKYGNGWNDIGYNFLVDRYGQIFEGRAGGIDGAIVGAQAGGYNTYSTGAALLGTFSAVGPPRKTFDALARLLAWKLALHGIQLPGKVIVQVSRDGAPYSRYRAGARVRLDRISGHRDADSTTCPGSGMYRQLPRLRQVVRGLIGTVGSLGLQNLGSAPGSATIGGLLAAAGVPTAGATVDVQKCSTTRGPTTLGTATTDANGAWSAVVPLVQNAVLRAVYRGDSQHSAVVSPVVVAVVPPQLVLSAATQQAPPGAVIDFSGSVTPAKPKLSIVISQQQLDGTFAPIRTIKLKPDKSGAFARSIGFPGGGQYQVVAQTDADNVNGPGASAPVAITIA